MRTILAIFLSFLVLTGSATMLVSNTGYADTGYPKDVQLMPDRYPVDTLAIVGYHNQIECMAKNIFFEAGNQELAGKIAVAHVVINRVESDRYPNTICGVIYDAQVSKWHKENTGKIVPLRDRCQFSWYCDGQPDVIPPGTSWENALAVAEEIGTNFYNDELGVDITDGAMYYHATYVKPYWAKSMTRIARIGDHIFYK